MDLGVQVFMMDENINIAIKDDIRYIVDNVKKALDIQKIILFGSYAYGNPETNSDIDLCFITNDKRSKIDIIMDIQNVIYGDVKHSVDIVVYNPEDFNYRADSIATIEKTISTKGVVLYG